MSKATLIRRKEARVVDLGTKVILKYTAPDKKLEFSHMTISGRHPDNPNHFIFEKGCHFMVYIVKGKGKIYCDEEVFDVSEGDVVDIPTHTKFAAEGKDFEYITVEHPAWYAKQAFIVDKKGKVVEDTKV